MFQCDLAVLLGCTEIQTHFMYVQPVTVSMIFHTDKLIAPPGNMA